MTIRLARLRRDELDAEIIGGWGLLALAAMSALWIRWIGSLPYACPFRAATGLPCPTCGATRAFAALLNGQVTASFWLNPAVPVAAAAALVFVPYALATSLLGLPRLRLSFAAAERRRLVWGAGVLVVALWSFLIVTAP